MRVCLPAWLQVVLALLGGTATGLLLKEQALFFKWIGEAFINAIHMLIVPVITTVIINAVVEMHAQGSMHRVLIKALTVYAISMAAAASLAMFVAGRLPLGVGLDLPLGEGGVYGEGLSWMDLAVHVFPESPVAALVDGNILQIIVFCAALGLSMARSGEKGLPMVRLFDKMSVVVFQLVAIVMRFAPLGIFSIMAWIGAEFGWAVLRPLMFFVGTVYLCCLLHMLWFYTIALLLYRVHPWRFFTGISSAVVMGFTTSSSAATLPESIRCAVDKLGIPPHLAKLLLPLGCSFNLNGLAIYLSVAVVFAAKLYGMPLDWVQQLTVVLTIMVTAVGAAGVPGTALVVMAAVMSAAGLPLGALPLLAGVDRLNDMAQTATNVTGDLVACQLVAASEREAEPSTVSSA